MKSGALLAVVAMPVSACHHSSHKMPSRNRTIVDDTCRPTDETQASRSTREWCCGAMARPARALNRRCALSRAARRHEALRRMATYSKSSRRARHHVDDARHRREPASRRHERCLIITALAAGNFVCALAPALFGARLRPSCHKRLALARLRERRRAAARRYAVASRDGNLFVPCRA